MHKKLRKAPSNKGIIILLFTVILVIAISLRLSININVDNEEGKASEPTYSCSPDARYIDVSMCPTYANYANNVGANAADFFNPIIVRAKNARTNPADEIVIRIPKASFYFLNQRFMDLEEWGESAYSNFHIKGVDPNNKPTFIDKTDNIEKNFLFFSHGNDNLKLSNLIFKGNNRNKYTSALVYIRNSGKNLVLENIECSGTYGDAPNEFEKGGACISVGHVAEDLPDKRPDYVIIKNSKVVDYHTAIVVDNAKRLQIIDNYIDNTNPCEGCLNIHGEGNVAIVVNGVNYENSQERSEISRNVLKQLPGKSEGETAIALLWVSNKVDILNNTMYDVQDTAMIIGNHGSDYGSCGWGAPKDISIQGNKFYRTELASIFLYNNAKNLGNCSPESAIMRDIKIIDNESYGGGGSIVAEAANHAPIYGLEIANNSIKDIAGGPGEDYWGVLDGTCITLAGLKGENNNYEDIKIHDNTLTNCRAGIYLRAAHWNDDGDFITRETNYVNGQNRKNDYISIYNNVIKNDGLNFSEILVQEKPVRGVENMARIRFSNNMISNILATPANGAKRCNATCSSNSECVVPKIQQVYSGIQGTPPNSSSIPTGYPTSYVCSSNKCKNSADVNDENCDLNNVNSVANQAPMVNAGVDQTITLPSNASLVGTATDDGLPNPPATLTYTWSKVTGAGTVTFSNASSLTTTASFSVAGTYTLRLTVSDSVLSTTDDITVIVNPPPQTGTVATPIINPNGGTFTSAQSVSISTTTSGSTIRYTTNGSDPTATSGTIYSAPVNISSTTTLKAIAYKAGMNASSIASAVFTINPPQGITEYSVVGTISYRYDNIPVTVTIKNGSTVVKTLTINSITSDNRIEFRLNSSEVGVGNYTVVVKPRYYTAREGNLTLGANQNVTFTVAGEYYAGKYTTSNPDKITILDVSRFLAYFRAGDHSKDLNGDQRINLLDLVKMLNDYRNSN